MPRRTVVLFCVSIFFAAILIVSVRDRSLSQNIFPPETPPADVQAINDGTSADGPTHAAPHIEFTATTHELGKIICGQTPTSEFSFKNSGNEMLVIKEVKGG